MALHKDRYELIVHEYDLPCMNCHSLLNSSLIYSIIYPKISKSVKICKNAE